MFHCVCEGTKLFQGTMNASCQFKTIPYVKQQRIFVYYTHSRTQIYLT